MSFKLFFVNNDPIEIRDVLNLITRKRLLRECNNKGFPEPVNVNKFCLVVSNQTSHLCYYYGTKPTIIMKLLPVELPKEGWIVSMKII